MFKTTAQRRPPLARKFGLDSNCKKVAGAPAARERPTLSGSGTAARTWPGPCSIERLRHANNRPSHR
eukprot:9420829-Ditylum_brightwellii.AAC.1